MYVAAWRFVVNPDRIDEFKKEYGPDGAWAKLFRRSDGYLRTELIPNRTIPLEFVTLDHWETKEAFDRFRLEYQEAYEQLDRRLAALTTHEERIHRPFHSFQTRIARELLNVLLIAVAIALAGMGIEGFLLSSNFIDGGVTGISMLLAQVTGLSLSLWLPVVNLPFIALGYRQIGPAFALRSMLGISGLAIALATFQYPDVTPDPVLTAVFGGFFLGAGIGLAVRGSAVLDGTEIAALLISKRSAVLKVGDVILGFNVVLFMVTIAVLGIEAALYSILTYLTAAKTLDFVIHGIEEYTAMTIVSSESAAIREAITGTLGRGVTVYRGYGGLTNSEQEILYCVVTRLEIGKVKTITQGIDENAFIVSHALADVDGGVVKKTALHMGK
jgi:uncharacterized membrane-anchored protein YitT (DUF2179 family)/heme-degrading monooxygenase HmoA